VRIKASLREETVRLQERFLTDEKTTLAIMEGLIALATADGEFSDLEREVYQTFLRQLALSNEQLKGLAAKVHADLAGVLNQLSIMDDSQARGEIARCFCLIAAASGDITGAERETLQRLLAALGEEHQLKTAEELCARFHREEGNLGRALGAVSDGFSTAASSASEAMGSALTWIQNPFSRQMKSNEIVAETQFHDCKVEVQSDEVLRKMSELDRQLASGVISAELYRSRWSELEAMLAKVGND
jgi:tellurite resistance protein